MQQPAEGFFAVRLADRAEIARLKRLIARELPVVRIGPVTAPQFTGKRMGIFQRHFAAVCLTDVGDHRAGLDGVVLHQFGNR